MQWTAFRKTMFPGQQENEQILLVVREHWLVFFLRFLSWLIFALILILADWGVATYFPSLLTSPYVYIFDLIKNLYLLFLLLGLLIIWTIYYLNTQVITNERIVDITQVSLVNHTISELHLSRIEDVTSEVNGVFGTMFNYGNVYVQTAGTVDRFAFIRVPNPAKIEKLILDLYEQLPDEAKQPKAPLEK